MTLCDDITKLAQLQRILNVVTQDLPLSSKRWVLLYLNETRDLKSMYETILFELPHLTAQALLSLVAEGAVYCNGSRVGADAPLPPTARLEIFEPKPWYRESLRKAFAAVTEQSLVYRDEHVVVAVKPAGLPTLPTRDQLTLNFQSAVSRLLKQIGYTQAVHIPSRLDAPVMGLIPIGIGQPASGRLQRQMERGEITKVYRALVEAQTSIPVVGTITLPIAKAYVHAVLRHISAEGQDACTNITEVVYLGDDRYLLTLQPVTGRTHQLRLHCAASGFPIVGDPFYNPAYKSDSSKEPLHLFCSALTFPHPISRIAIHVSVPPVMLPAWLYLSNK